MSPHAEPDLRIYRELVLYIANDVAAMDSELIRAQRDNWQDRCRKLIDELDNSKHDANMEKDMTFVGYSW